MGLRGGNREVAKLGACTIPCCCCCTILQEAARTTVLCTILQEEEAQNCTKLHNLLLHNSAERYAHKSAQNCTILHNLVLHNSAIMHNGTRTKLQKTAQSAGGCAHKTGSAAQLSSSHPPLDLPPANYPSFPLYLLKYKYNLKPNSSPNRNTKTTDLPLQQSSLNLRAPINCALR